MVARAQVVAWGEDLHERNAGRVRNAPSVRAGVIAGRMMKLRSYSFRDGASTFSLLSWRLALSLILVALFVSEEYIAMEESVTRSGLEYEKRTFARRTCHRQSSDMVSLWCLEYVSLMSCFRCFIRESPTRSFVSLEVFRLCESSTADVTGSQDHCGRYQVHTNMSLPHERVTAEPHGS